VDANDWKSLAIGALTLVVSGVIWYLKELTAQVRENRDKLTQVDKHHITREELHRELKEARETGDKRHEDNQKVQYKILDSMNVVALEIAVIKRLYQRDTKQ
jgi:hypothetical protein